MQRELEGLIQERSFERAATLALETYGPELFGFLVHTLGKEPDAEEVFAELSENLWRGLPTFASRCSVRTWLYVLARHAAVRYRRSPWNQRDRRTGSAEFDRVVQTVATRTEPWLRTDVKDRWHQLRESLDEADRSLLVLRVDRGLSWDEVARVLCDPDEPDDAALAREVARVRKRFQLLKDDLRRRAREAGLLEDQHDA